MKRFLKNGLIKANKLGRQYRILGKELLRIVSPQVEATAVHSYLKLKQKVVNKINKWWPSAHNYAHQSIAHKLNSRGSWFF